jgi:hypothetical protein
MRSAPCPLRHNRPTANQINKIVNRFGTYVPLFMEPMIFWGPLVWTWGLAGNSNGLDPDGPPARRAYASESDWYESAYVCALRCIGR